MEKDKEIIFRN